MRKIQLKKKIHKTFLGREKGRRNLLYVELLKQIPEKNFSIRNIFCVCVSKVVMINKCKQRSYKLMEKLASSVKFAMPLSFLHVQFLYALLQG